MYYKVKIDPQDVPQSPENPNIASRLKSIDREKANSELEKNEVVYSPDNTLKKVVGKTHAQGGVPLLLDHDSFIFSDYKKLAIPKKDFQTFGLKTPSSITKNNTPAKVLGREIDLKHHNRMVDIAQSRMQDNISKNSANLMIAKNTEKVGQIAFLQEQQKGFPDGIPPFAENTSPVFSKTTDTDIDQSKQYMKTGGLTKHPDGGFLPFSGYEFNCPCGRNIDGSCKQCGDTPAEIAASKNMAAAARIVGAVPPGYSSIGSTGVNLFSNTTNTPSVQTPGPKMSNQAWAAFVNSPAGRASAYKRNGYKDDQVTTQSPIGRIGEMGPQNWIDPTAPPELLAPRRVPSPGITPLVMKRDSMGEAPGSIKYTTQGTTYHTPLTAWQGFNIAKPFYDAATAKTIYPIRQHQESVVPQVQLMSDQPQLNQVNQGYFNAAQSLRSMNPQLASAYVQQLAGNRLDQADQVVGSTQNQNVQLINQQKQLAAQLLNQDAGQNRQFDLQYKTGVDTANQRTDDMKSFLKNQGLSTANQYIAENQAFNNRLNSQVQYKTDQQIGTNPDGTPIYRTRALYEPRSNGFGYDVNYTPNLNVNFQNLPGQADKQDYLNQYFEYLRRLKESGLDNISGSAQGLSRILGASSLKGLDLNSSDQKPFKKGGRFRYMR